MLSAIREEVDVPEGVELKLSGKAIEVSGPKGKLARKFDVPGIGLRMEGKKILIEISSPRRKLRAALGMVRARLVNMFKGVTAGFTYKLRVVYSHFPITVKIEGKRALIQNFLGERAPRVAKIIGDVKVEVKGEEIIVQGIDRDEVGQTAFNIEQATFIRHRDPRVFQDGCYIVEKA
ncbi:MAG: 50S ribosomal protein L6 [Hadesarchaea archaeon]|nr:MAG: 50S ribosomal protein L6 [Hadesarchaea archaeon]